MTRLGFALSMAALVGSAGWAYHVNYETGEALRRVEGLRLAIARERERLQVLAVDWAMLNRPDRLRRLVAEHNGRLLLMPMAPDHYRSVAQVPYPPPPPLVADAAPDPDPAPAPFPGPVEEAGPGLAQVLAAGGVQ